MIKGLGRVGSGGPRENEAIKLRVASTLAEVGPGLDVSVVDVIIYGAGYPVYNVELKSEESVKALLSAFSRFTRRRDPVPRPQSLDKISLHHAVTVGTRVRLSLLRVSFLSIRTLFVVVYISV